MVCAAIIAAAITLVNTAFAPTVGARTTLHVPEDGYIFFGSAQASPTAYLLDGPNGTAMVSESPTCSTNISWGSLLNVVVNDVRPKLLTNNVRRANALIATSNHRAQSSAQLYHDNSNPIKVMQADRPSYLTGAANNVRVPGVNTTVVLTRRKLDAMAETATITAAITQVFANLAPLTHAAPAPAVVAVTALLDYGHVLGHAKICVRSTQALPTSFLLTKLNVATRSSKSCWNTLAVILNFMTSHGPATLTETCATFDTFIDAGNRHMQNSTHVYHYLMRSDDSSSTLATIQAVQLAYLAGGASTMKSSRCYNALKLDILSLHARVKGLEEGCRSGRHSCRQERFDQNDHRWAEKENAFADQK
jgi:hypothetical protein